MTPVAVQRVAPAKGVKAYAGGTTPTTGIAASNDAGDAPRAAVACTAPCAVAIRSSSWPATLSLPRPETSSC